MIEFKGVKKVYDDGFEALKGINLEIKQGEITVFIGPSGCGKTTTMRMINRLNVPSHGQILINGDDISKMDAVELRRKIGYVIQSVGLFPNMTIAKNVGVVPRLQKWDKEKIDNRVNELMNQVRLSPETFGNRYPSELSGGQQQRIGVIRALAADPDIILLDEPFSALDPISREELQDELIRLQTEVKKTIVFVTHDMDEAIKLADTIVLMKDGQIEQVGTPDQILRHPASPFVESFIGKNRMISNNDSDFPNVEEVMIDNPATAFPTRGIAESVTILQRRKVDSLVIVDKSKQLLGTVTIYQLIKHYREEDKKIADIMTPVEHVVLRGTSVTTALAILNEHHLSNLPVVDEHGKFHGLITRGSVVRLLADVYTPDTEEADASANL
ncbi:MULTISPECIES: betaine/proline/choline family ABC transporter ATP-binding protein [unclassified Paenibacillus]|uniref:Quaternary amine transport ATP-binding protein n=1 Tax=Paenibacillus provencensis TaxID=441151 RepID=A0ABW3Q3P2_9BACL|nr:MULTISPECIES: betaine/proline/choline family ABC transporter ATP-binding protein [unclassified Paenibacillus]MCM3127288.1 betaine/proline/choline family ABC transporter ATP-binding protein [Paenibacillus sp. MER 78]SFS44677.1 osmoprotectant transport system ATP-binding protein [Paenibacillus sp. 453mf]